MQTLVNARIALHLVQRNQRSDLCQAKNELGIGRALETAQKIADQVPNTLHIIGFQY
jgi:hypothetical protein